MTIDTSQIKISTKGIVSAVLAFGSLMQVPAFSALVLGFADHHPHISSIVAAGTAIAALLHNPTVQNILGIKETVTDTNETVTIAPTEAK